MEQRKDVSEHAKVDDGVHGSDVAKKAENSDKNKDKTNGNWPKNQPDQKPPGEDKSDIQDIPGVGRDQASGLMVKSIKGKK